MEILHLSDLHVTTVGETLASVYSPVRNALHRVGRKRFDAVIVSGDLTQEAKAGAYEDLLQLARTELVRLVDSDPRRVIFVPGNHDVEWGAEVLDPCETLRIDAKAAHKLSEDVRHFKRSPAASDLRLAVGNYGHAQFFRRKVGSDYSKRFASVQKFLDEFYGSVLDSDGKKFNLTSEREGDDWSLHLIKAEDSTFAIFGFNSCEQNDALWHGARIGREAIGAAERRLQELSSTEGRIVPLAVWHHGFSGEVGRPDHLALGDLGAIYNAGFHIGFHGHTHKDESKLIDLCQDRFAIISTGSVGAGSRDRPDAIPNQFSIVTVSAKKVQVDRYDRTGPASEFSVEANRRTYSLYRTKPSTLVTRESQWARRQVRRWTVGADGVMDVRVQMDDVETRGADVQLSVLSKPFGGHVADGRVGAHSVSETRLPDGRLLYTMDGSARSISRIEWGYSVANALLLRANESDILEQRKVNYEHRPTPEWDMVTHRVRLDCAELTLSLHFAEASHVRIEDSKVIVETEGDDVSEDPWPEVVEESERLRRDLKVEQCSLSLTIKGPQVGYRYALAYRPQRDVDIERPQISLGLASSLLRNCQKSATTPKEISRLASRVAGGVARACKTEKTATIELLGVKGSWCCFLWEQSKKRLFPAFGAFRPQTWGLRLQAGEGVAGHAFRFNTIATWHTERRAGQSVIHLPEPGPGDLALMPRVYKWIVAVPVLVFPRRIAIGVVSFAGTDDEGRIAATLAAIAKEDSAAMTQDATDLVSAVNAAFWNNVPPELCSKVELADARASAAALSQG